MIKEFRNFINRGNVVELGVAFVMFLVIKAYNHFEDMVDDEEVETEAVAESKEVQLLKEIRDGINKISNWLSNII